MAKAAIISIVKLGGFSDPCHTMAGDKGQRPVHNIVQVGILWKVVYFCLLKINTLSKNLLLIWIKVLSISAVAIISKWTMPSTKQTSYI